MVVTQKQIAEVAGVSQPVVARVLSGHPHVALKTRTRVEQVAADLGYSVHSNGHARALAARRHGQETKKGVIAVLYWTVTESNKSPLRGNPFFTPLFSGVDRAAESRGTDVCFFPMRESGLPRMITERNVDGVICIGSSEPTAAISELELPTIGLDLTTPYGYGLVPDDREGARLATRHLIDLGHREIAYLSYDLNSKVDSAEKRIQGYRDALNEAGLSFDQDLVIESEAYMDISVGHHAINNLMNRGGHWTGLVCYNDMLAMGAINGLKAAGKSVPEDVSVVGFDDVSRLYHFSPILTSVAFDREAMGRRAVELLHNWREEVNLEVNMSDGTTRRFGPQVEIFPVKLIEGQSTARPNI